MKNITKSPILASNLVILLCCFNTMLCVAQISPTNNGSWQDSSIWTGGQLPGASDDVIIPAGFLIDLTGNIAVKSITINGTLRAMPGASIQLETEWIMVMGNNALFEIGTAASPFNDVCTITMIGLDDGDDIMGMGDKFIIAMNGGTIEFHGQQKVSWTNLGTDVNSGSNQITMAAPIDWTVGDEIVIVSSSTDWEEAEKRTITAISSDDLTITLNNSLNYPHTGLIQTYIRNTDGKTWTADLRAEVGLLTHNVKIQGDANSELDGFGTHIMAMPNSTINASSIELYRMGQKAKIGRYPWHWHMLDAFGTGQYFINSSVHRSFNRAIAIHGTSYVNVENNFFYDHIGHGVFLEDGSERFNTIKDNVVLLTKRPLVGEELTPSDNEFDEVQNRTPSSFWITNPNNIFEGNVAAGTEGTGYWFALPQTPMGASANDIRFNGIEPYKEPLGSFKYNKAHSCMNGFDIFDQLNPDHSIKTNAGWFNSSQHLIEGCTWYANNLALYTGISAGVGDLVAYSSNLIFLDNVLVENVTAMQFASYSQVQESVFVALGLSPTSLYRIYDGAGQIRDCHLVGWNGNNVDFLGDGGGATKHTNHRMSGITTDDGLPPLVHLEDYDIPISNSDFTPQSLSHPRVWNIVLYDEDGSFSGVPNSSIVSNHPMMLVGDEYQPPNWVNAYRSPHKFALSILEFPGLATADYPNVTCTRTKTGTPTESVYYIYGYKEHIQLPFIVNEGFIYNYQFESLPTSQSFYAVMDDAEVGDTYLIRFKDFGKLGGLNLIFSTSSVLQYTLMNDLLNSNQTAFLIEPNGDLYLKCIATQHLQYIGMSWTTDFSLPILDTDGDGISDRDEIENGTDPFPTCALMDLTFNFDATPQQTSWQILDASGTPVASGGGYNLGNNSANESVCIFDGCYELVVSDSANNGMCPFRATASSGGTFITPGTVISPGTLVATLGTVVTPGLCGNYNLQDANGNIIANGGGSFGASESNSFCIAGGVQQFVNDDVDYARQIPNTNEYFRLYPNPTNDILNIQFKENTTSEIELNIIDITGKTIHTETRAIFDSNIQLNINNLNSGIYFIQIIDKKKIMSEKFVVE